jgi:hypothetical protein
MVPVVGLCVASFLPASVAAETVFVNKGSKLCLDATAKRDSAFVQQSKCNSKLDGQKWQIVDRGHGSYWIKNKWTGTCLDIYTDHQGETPWLNTVTTSKCEGWKKNQEWEKLGKYRLRNAHTNQCLVAPGTLNLGPVKAVSCKKGAYFNWTGGTKTKK